MKKANTWITIIAITILGLVGFYLIKENKTPEEKTYSEIIDGEVVVLDHPLTESFSNAESNEGVAEQIQIDQASSVAYYAKKIAEPFILGFYYMKNLDKVGVDGCTLLNEDDSEGVNFPDYNKDNFVLTDVTIVDNSAFLFIEADEIPKKVCAQIIQFNELTNDIFNAIHVFIK